MSVIDTTELDPTTQARADGYDWSEINSHIAQGSLAAQAEGYSQDDIDEHLGYQPENVSQENARASWADHFSQNPDHVEELRVPDKPFDLGLNPNLVSDYISGLLGGEVKGPNDFVNDYMAGAHDAAHGGGGLDTSPSAMFARKHAMAASANTIADALPNGQDLTDAALSITGGETQDIADVKAGLMENWKVSGEHPIDAAIRADNESDFRDQLSAYRQVGGKLAEGLDVMNPLKAAKDVLDFLGYKYVPEGGEAKAATPVTKLIDKLTFQEAEASKEDLKDTLTKPKPDRGLVDYLLGTTPDAPPGFGEAMNKIGRDAVEPFFGTPFTELPHDIAAGKASTVVGDVLADITTVLAFKAAGKYVVKPIYNAIADRVGDTHAGTAIAQWYTKSIENVANTLNDKSGHGLASIEPTIKVRNPDEVGAKMVEDKPVLEALLPARPADVDAPTPGARPNSKVTLGEAQHLGRVASHDNPLEKSVNLTLHNLHDAEGNILGELEITRDPEKPGVATVSTIHVGEGYADSATGKGRAGSNQLGARATRDLARQYFEANPSVDSIEGFRMTGARDSLGAGKTVNVTRDQVMGPGKRFDPEAAPAEKLQALVRDAGKHDGDPNFFEKLAKDEDPKTVELAKSYDTVTGLYQMMRNTFGEFMKDESGAVRLGNITVFGKPPGPASVRDLRWGSYDHAMEAIKRLNGRREQWRSHVESSATAGVHRIMNKHMGEFEAAFEANRRAPGSVDILNDTELGRMISRVSGYSPQVVNHSSNLAPLERFIVDSQRLAAGLTTTATKQDRALVRVSRNEANKLTTLKNKLDREKNASYVTPTAQANQQARIAQLKLDVKAQRTTAKAAARDAKNSALVTREELHKDLVRGTFTDPNAADALFKAGQLGSPGGTRYRETILADGIRAGLEPKEKNIINLFTNFAVKTKSYVDAATELRDVVRNGNGMVYSAKHGRDGDIKLEGYLTQAYRHSMAEPLWANPGFAGPWNRWVDRMRGTGYMEDLKNLTVWDKLQYWANMSVVGQLLWPGFHFLTMLEGTYTAGLRNVGAALMHGNFSRAGKEALLFPVSPVRMIVSGYNARAMYRSMANVPVINHLVDVHARFDKRAQEYRLGQAESLITMFRRGELGRDFQKNLQHIWGDRSLVNNVGGMPLRLAEVGLHEIGNLLETGLKPFWSDMIPLWKDGANVTAGRIWLENHPRATQAQTTRYFDKLAKNTDDRMGELQQENLDWNKWVLRSLNTVFISMPSWVHGSIRWMGAAAGVDVDRALRGRNPLTWNGVAMGTLLSWATVQATGNTVYDYISTGSFPWEKPGNPILNTLMPHGKIPPGFEKEILDLARVVIMGVNGGWDAFVQELLKTYAVNRINAMFGMGLEVAVGKDALEHDIKNMPGGWPRAFSERFAPIILQNMRNTKVDEDNNWFETMFAFRPSPKWMTDPDGYWAGRAKKDEISKRQEMGRARRELANLKYQPWWADEVEAAKGPKNGGTGQGNIALSGGRTGGGGGFANPGGPEPDVFHGGKNTPQEGGPGFTNPGGGGGGPGFANPGFTNPSQPRSGGRSSPSRTSGSRKSSGDLFNNLRGVRRNRGNRSR